MPTLAEVYTRWLSMMGFNSKAGRSEKIRPILPLVYSSRALS